MMPRVNSMNILLVGLLATVLWLGLGAGVCAEKLPSLGERSGRPIATPQTRQLGDEFMREARRQLVFVRDPVLLAYVQALGSRVSASVADDGDFFRFHLVRNGEVNAFAVPGGHVVLYTTLILETESEGQLASVVAHEVAHLVQRHPTRSLARSHGRELSASAGMLVAVLLGGQAGAATMAATSAMAVGDRLRYSRAFEQEADTVGLDLLASAGYNPHSAVDFLHRLERGSRVQGLSPPEYLLTHPLSTRRVAEVRSRIERYATVTDGHGSDFAHARARIRALFEPNPEAAADYFASPAGSDVLVKRAARYGLALVKSRLGAHDEALRILQQLVSDYPDDLHYPLALAESHVAAGALRSALSPLRSARARWPDEPILYGAEANVLIKIGEASLAKSMIRAALRLDNDSVVLYRLLARAEGQLGNMAPSFQALAEASYLEGEPTRALAELSRAEKHAGHSTYLATSISARMAVLRELIDRRATH